MNLDPNALVALRAGLKEGDIKFRFEGMFKGKVARWIELTGTRTGTTWTATMTTGDGRTLKKEDIPDAEAEDHFVESILTIHNWLNQDPRS